MTWDVDEDNTSAILEDMGVSMLEDDLEANPGPTPTPPGGSNIADNLIPPGVCIKKNIYKYDFWKKSLQI